MSEMVERVAKAIAAERAEPWDDMNDDERRSWSETASAAIEAMMEAPTVNMIDAACAAWADLHPGYPGEKPEPTAGDVVVAVFRAMLSEALVNRKE